uniref:LRRCT domain-containing protein n=1 Tax=Photinus pyralis TaxID=7054 RepID=A0A1Y1KJS7_PHOPY
MVNATVINYLMLLSNSFTDIPEYGLTSHMGVDYYDARNENGLSQLIRRVPEGLDRHYVLNVKVGANVPLNPRTFEDLQKLEILNLVLETPIVPEDIFSRLYSLKCLTIWGEFETVDKRALHGLQNLEQLQLSRSNHFPSRVFDCLRSVKLLDLSWNTIANITSLFHADLPQLSFLLLGGNQIRQLSVDNFNKVPNLKKLNLDNNQISMIEPGSLSMAKLGKLTLRHNALRSLHEAMFPNLPGLIHVDLQNNHIREIHPETFARNPRLDTLFLGHNQLESLNWLSYGLVHASTLYLNNNQLSALQQADFENSRRLQVINLSHNNISTVEFGTLDDLHNLTHLDLSHNRLEHLDRSLFSRAIHLQYLNLSHNEIADFDPILFGQNTKLKSLHLSHNKIRKLPPGAFASLDSLWYLHLDHNRIQSLSSYGFLRLANLWELNLAHNNISVINGRAFYGLKHLGKLFLNNNSLERVGATTFAGLRYLQRMNLYGNRFECVNEGVFQHLRRAKIVVDDGKVKVKCAKSQSFV